MQVRISEDTVINIGDTNFSIAYEKELSEISGSHCRVWRDGTGYQARQFPINILEFAELVDSELTSIDSGELKEHFGARNNPRNNHSTSILSRLLKKSLPYFLTKNDHSKNYHKVMLINTGIPENNEGTITVGGIGLVIDTNDLGKGADKGVNCLLVGDKEGSLDYMSMCKNKNSAKKVLGASLRDYFYFEACAGLGQQFSKDIIYMINHSGEDPCKTEVFWRKEIAIVNIINQVDKYHYISVDERSERCEDAANSPLLSKYFDEDDIPLLRGEEEIHEIRKNVDLEFAKDACRVN